MWKKIFYNWKYVNSVCVQVTLWTLYARVASKRYSWVTNCYTFITADSFIVVFTAVDEFFLPANYMFE